MTDLFNKSDVLTVLTKENAKVGDKGYFGDSLKMLDTNVKNGEVHSLVKIYDEDRALFPFGSDHLESHRFALFLPADKVKNKEPTYRPLANIAELIDFLVPEHDRYDVCDIAPDKMKIAKYKNAEILLGRKITLRQICADNVTIKVIQNIDFHNDGNTSNTIYLNNESLDFLFDNYEILIDGEWLPFGIEE